MKPTRFLLLCAALLLLCACASGDPAVSGPPEASAAPVQPVEPTAPIAPTASAEPVEPTAPTAPTAPAAPVAPVAPSEPVEPTAPVAPAEPTAPVEPAAPAAPEAVPEPEPVPVPQPEPPSAPETPAKPSVTVSISCAALLDNLDSLDAAKHELVPADGVLLAETALELSDGESVFDLLSRAARDAGLHLEHSSTPMYNSAYIEGIGNLYEFDCGPLSGWMYRVNGEFPHFGCSKYAASDGDAIEWLYTCDLGADIGGEDAYAAQRE